MSNAITHRLVAVVGRWSAEHLADLPAADRRRPVPRAKPGSHSIVLSAEFRGTPAQEAVEAALAVSGLMVSGYEGHAFLHSYAPLGSAEWAAFVAWEGPDVEDRIRRSAGEDSPQIAFFIEAAHAQRALGGSHPIPRLPPVPSDWRPSWADL